MLEFYDKQGNAIYDDEAIRLRAHPTYWTVAQDRVQGWLVSTVWLGMNHSWEPGAPPLIFETMVFPPESSSDEYFERYATEEEALAGHQKALGWLLDKLGPQAIDYIDYEEASGGMKFSIFMAIVFAVAAIATYRPRSNPRRRRYRYYDYYGDHEQEPARPLGYRAPPPVEPQEFTDEDSAALRRRMSAQDAETLALFEKLNAGKEPDSAEITDLRNSVISRGWRPKSDTAAPTLTGTIVQEIPEEAPEPEISEPNPQVAGYSEQPEWEEWKQMDWGGEPDLLRDGLEITMRKLTLKYFSDVPALEGSQA